MSVITARYDSRAWFLVISIYYYSAPSGSSIRAMMRLWILQGSPPKFSNTSTSQLIFSRLSELDILYPFLNKYSIMVASSKEWMTCRVVSLVNIDCRISCRSSITLLAPLIRFQMSAAQTLSRTVLEHFPIMSPNAFPSIPLRFRCLSRYSRKSNFHISTFTELSASGIAGSISSGRSSSTRPVLKSVALS